MAKITQGVIAADARGRLGSLVFTRGHYGNVIRELAIPLNTRTGPQMAVRAGVSTLAKRWSTILSDSDRTDWIGLASTVTRYDSLGQIYHPTGMNLYLGCNQALKQIGQPYIDAAPGSLSVGNPVALTTSWTPPAGPLTVDASSEPGTHDVPVIFASAGLPPGRAKTVSFVRQLTYEPANTSGPWDITVEWEAHHGDFVPRLSVTIGVKYTDDRTGYQSVAAITMVYISPV